MIDLTGQRFARWLVKSRDETTSRPTVWFCVCDCGTEKRVIGRSLRNGRSKSCGCWASQENVRRFTTHGMHKHPAYFSWRAMLNRCNLPGDPGYPEYGARGIVVCDQWRTFEQFWEDMGPTWQKGLSIDRMEVNGNYEPNNCRWATAKQQANNRRDNQIIPTAHGPMTVSEASQYFGVNRSTIMRRMRDGWDRNRLLEPAQFHPRWHNTQETP